jgi:hypothetical protein
MLNSIRGDWKTIAKKVFAARSGDGDSVAGNIRAAVNEARKKYQGWGLSKFDVETATASFEYSLKYSVNSMDEFAVFMDKKKLKILANDLFEKLKKEMKRSGRMRTRLSSFWTRVITKHRLCGILSLWRQIRRRRPARPRTKSCSKI